MVALQGIWLVLTEQHISLILHVSVFYFALIFRLRFARDLRHPCANGKSQSMFLNQIKQKSQHGRIPTSAAVGPQILQGLRMLSFFVICYKSTFRLLSQIFQGDFCFLSPHQFNSHFQSQPHNLRWLVNVCQHSRHTRHTQFSHVLFIPITMTYKKHPFSFCVISRSCNPK